MIIRATATSNFMGFQNGDNILLEVPELTTPATIRGRLLVHAQVQNGLFFNQTQQEIDRKTVITSKAVHVAYCGKDGFLAIQFEGNEEPSVLTARVYRMDKKYARKLGRKLIEKKVRYVPPKAQRKPFKPVPAHART